MAATIKGKQVSTNVEPEYYDALNDYHWSARKKISEIVREALDDYAEKHSIPIPHRASDEHHDPDDQEGGNGAGHHLDVA